MVADGQTHLNEDVVLSDEDVAMLEARQDDGDADTAPKGPPPRRAWIAVLLALLSPIAGVLYAGAPRWVWPFLAAQIIMAVWLMAGWTASFVGFFGYLGVLFAQGLLGMLVAGILAARHRHITYLAPYQRYWVYLLIIVAFGAGQRLAATVDGPAAVGIKSSSMFPTIWSSDLVLATGGAYSNYEPARGDIVVYWHPKQPEERWIKRIVALPGDQLRLDDGLISIGDNTVGREKLDPYVWSPRPEITLTFEQRLEQWPASLDQQARSFQTVHVGDLTSDYHNFDGLTVPDGHVFVMGDYRDNSLDSRTRFHGPLPIDNITHRVVGILWSPRRQLSLMPIYSSDDAE